MKKLALKLDDLWVETFTTAEQPGVKGTVAGYYGGNHTLQVQTCWASCFGTCVEVGCDTEEGTCFVSCNQTECWQGTQCVVW